MKRLCILTFLAFSGTFCTALKQTPKPVIEGPWLLHAWLFYKHDVRDLMQVVDSSKLSYTLYEGAQVGGYREMNFSFAKDPSERKKQQLFVRLKRYAGIRGYTTTRGEKEK